VPDKATGFTYNRDIKQWGYAVFTPPQFVIQPAKNGHDTYDVKDVKENSPPGGCEKDFNDAGTLRCVTPGGELRFNRVNRRFVRVFEDAYYTVGLPGRIKETDEDSGAPMIEIGKCTPF
jgi:hypothetical protein